jgi:PhnB protein
MADHPREEQLDQLVDSLLGAATAPRADDASLASLAVVAEALRYLPSEAFRDQLKTELQRRISMSAETTRVHAAFRTVWPFIIHERASELVDFLKQAFDADELRRDTSAEAYGFHAEVGIGDSLIMIGGGSAAEHGNVPGAFHVFVDDCDAVYRRALSAGATTLMGAMGEPSDRPYGERSAFVEDQFGNYWYIATPLTGGGPAPAPPDRGSVVPHLHPTGARAYIAFLQAAFAGEPMAVVERVGRVMHAAVRIGDAVLELGEPEDRSGIPLGGFFVRVDDVEAAYARALAAGATSIRPPADIPYDYRSAIVQDASGYMWWVARLKAK